MMEEVDQWANFGTFDFTSLSPLHNDDHSSSKDQDVPNELATIDGASLTSESNSRSDDVFSFSQDFRDLEYLDRMRAMEREQDLLNSSLISLTTHFAQVQFRLKQISSTQDIDIKEKLIRDLEVFTSEGCLDVRAMTREPEVETETEHQQNYDKQVAETQALIQRLQKQLTDVEQWAYESGQSDPPSLAVLEKQKMILDALQEKIKLGIDGFEHLPPEELRTKVDKAVESIISPYRKKAMDQERTVTQMQTFVEDLERYIDHLHHSESDGQPAVLQPLLPKSTSVEGIKQPPDDHKAKQQSSLTNLLQRTYHVMQFVPIMNLCVRQPRFHPNAMKTTPKGNHWGDIRAILELAITTVLEVAQKRQNENRKMDKDKRNNTKEPVTFDDRKFASESLTRAVRKKLAPALSQIMSHGLMKLSDDRSLVPSLLCTSKNRNEVVEMHPWDLIMRYYDFKKGSQLRHSATRKLADSFQLSAVGENKITPLDSLLGSVGEIMDSHEKFNQTPMTLFKAFVCAALNKKSLATWLRLIYCTKVITDEYYMSWSYACRTHFDDTCYSLERLSPFDFNLQVDIAIKPFASLNEAF